jgi:hypothetical protein
VNTNETWQVEEQDLQGEPRRTQWLLGIRWTGHAERPGGMGKRLIYEWIRWKMEGVKVGIRAEYHEQQCSCVS